MKGATLFYALFVAALLAVVIGLPAMMRSDAPTGSGFIEGLVSPGALSAAHRSLGGQCMSCHTPAKGVEPRKCLTCHLGTDFGGKQSTRFHGAAAQCTSCHVEHDGGRSLARMNHSALLDRRLWDPSTAMPPLAAGSGARTLDCATCHSFRDPHQGLFGAGCASCHTLSSWDVDGYRHPSVNSTACGQCHRAPRSHYMEHFRMVSQRAAREKAQVDQCYACHTTDSFNNIRSRGWYDHH